MELAGLEPALQGAIDSAHAAGRRIVGPSSALGRIAPTPSPTRCGPVYHQNSACGRAKAPMAQIGATDGKHQPVAGTEDRVRAPGPGPLWRGALSSAVFDSRRAPRLLEPLPCIADAPSRVSLWLGHRWARCAGAALQLVNLGLGVSQTLRQSGTGFWNGFLQIVLALVVLALLCAGRSDAFFADSRRSSEPRRG
jgi:hypothetical protein